MSTPAQLKVQRIKEARELAARKKAVKEFDEMFGPTEPMEPSPVDVEEPVETPARQRYCPGHKEWKDARLFTSDRVVCLRCQEPAPSRVPPPPPSQRPVRMDIPPEWGRSSL
jgi:hypothetical protein